MTKEGRIAVLTNFREEGAITQTERSRGLMVNAFLTSQQESTKAFVEELFAGEGVQGIGGFNLVCGRVGEPLAIVSNRTPDVEGAKWIAEQRGQTVALSNAAYGDRSWPKVPQGERLLAEALSESSKKGESEDDLVKRLLILLSTDTLPKRKTGESWHSYVYQLRNSIFIPPIGGEGMDEQPADHIAAAKTSEHVDVASNGGQQQNGFGLTGMYGTQNQSVILVDHHGRVKYFERTLYDDDAKPVEKGKADQVFEFDIKR